MRLSICLLLVAGLLMGGCASQSEHCGELIARAGCPPGTPGHEAEKQQQLDARTLATIDDARCQSYAGLPGSPAYARCRADIAAKRAEGIKVPSQ